MKGPLRYVRADACRRIGACVVAADDGVVELPLGRSSASPVRRRGWSAILAASGALCLLAFWLLPSHSVPPRVPPAGDIALERAAARTARPVTGARPRYGLASYYARHFDGRKTASGRRFDNDAMLAAHPTYPFGTVVRVTNLRNQRAVNVHIVDRGPSSGPRSHGVIIDVSRAAAEALGFVGAGRTRVRLDVVGRPAA